MGKKRKYKRKEDEIAPLEQRSRDSCLVVPAAERKLVVGELMNLLHEVVKEQAEAAYHMSVLANAHVLRCIKNGSVLPKIDAAFYDLCFRMVSTGRKAPTVNEAKACGLFQTMDFMVSTSTLPYLRTVTTQIQKATFVRPWRLQPPTI